MLVSHQKKFIYIKGSKVAGTSTEVFFQPACQMAHMPITRVTDEYIGPEGIVGARGVLGADGKVPRFTEHMLPREIKEALGDEIWQSYFVFSNIRNPFTAEISRAMHRARARNQILGSTHELMEDVALHIETSNANGRQFIRDGVCWLNDVIRFEALNEDIYRVASRIGFKTDGSVPHLQNKTKEKKGITVEELWHPELRDQLVQKRRAYFEVFGYSTDPRDADLAPPLPPLQNKEIRP